MEYIVGIKKTIWYETLIKANSKEEALNKSQTSFLDHDKQRLLVLFERFEVEDIKEVKE